MPDTFTDVFYDRFGGPGTTVTGATVTLRSVTTWNVLENTLQIENAMDTRSTAELVIETTSTTSRFRKGEPITIAVAGSTVFAGMIETADIEARPPEDVVYWRFRCVDWHALTDRRVVAAAYTDMKADNIVRDIITNFLAADGITTGVLDVAPTIEEISFNYVFADEAIDRLADLSGFEWWIGPQKRLYFQERSSNVAPWALTWDDVDGTVPTLTAAAPEYRNKQWIIGGSDETATQTEKFVGDGQRRAFTTSYPVNRVPTVILNTVSQSVGIRGVATNRDFYWQKGSNVISQDAADPALTISDTLEVQYKGTFPIVAVVQNPTEVSRMVGLEGFGTGIWDQVDVGVNITKRSQAFASASSLLFRYSKEARRLTFRTIRSGLSPGQILTVTLPEYGLTGNEFLVTDVDIADEFGVCWYTVRAAEGPAGRWSRYFKWLARQVPRVVRENVSEQQVVALIETVADTHTWGEAVAQTVTACPVPSSTLFPGSTLYPC